MLHTICAEVVEPRLAGSAIGSNLLATSIGGTIGPLIFGVLIDWTGGYSVSWLMTGLVIFFGVFALAIGLREDQDSKSLS